MGEVQNLITPSIELQEGNDLQIGVKYKPKNFGVIGDALVYPWSEVNTETIRILNIIEKDDGACCDIGTRSDVPGCEKPYLEVIFQGGIIRTTLENIRKILLREEHNKKEREAA